MQRDRRIPLRSSFVSIVFSWRSGYRQGSGLMDEFVFWGFIQNPHSLKERKRIKICFTVCLQLNLIINVSNWKQLIETAKLSQADYKANLLIYCHLHMKMRDTPFLIHRISMMSIQPQLFWKDFPRCLGVFKEIWIWSRRTGSQYPLKFISKVFCIDQLSSSISKLYLGMQLCSNCMLPQIGCMKLPKMRLYSETSG